MFRENFVIREKHLTFKGTMKYNYNVMNRGVLNG